MVLVRFVVLLEVVASHLHLDVDEKNHLRRSTNQSQGLTAPVCPNAQPAGNPQVLLGVTQENLRYLVI